MIDLTRREFGTTVAFSLVGTAARAAVAEQAVPAIWDLTPIFPDDTTWETSRSMLLISITSGSGPKNLATIDGGGLATLLEHASDVRRQALRLDTYASLKLDVDPSPINQSLRGRSQELSAVVEQSLDWLEPSINALGGARISQLLATEPRLGPFRLALTDALRRAPHAMSDEARAILGSNALADAPEALQHDLAATARGSPAAQLSNGRSVPVDERSFALISQSPSSADRERVARAYWGSYAKLENAFGLTLTAAVQADVLRAKAEKFRNSREAALFALALPDEVYTAMLDAVRQGMPTLHRYYALRRRMLKLPVLRASDLIVPLVPTNQVFDLRHARNSLLAAVQPLGSAYVDHLSRATLAGWMDAYPRPGKRAGGYCNPGAYDVHPYILLNFTPTYNGTMSFAHEWGHAMHAELARAAQPFQTFNAPPFVQEIASTCHEQLLVKHMLRAAQSRGEKLFYLGQQLDTIASVFFGQAMRAEFEAELHQLVEAGQVLDGGGITDLYMATWRRYAGSELFVEREFAIAWARQVQYYDSFYVFQYVTALTGAVHFSKSLLADPKRGSENYLSMLRAGGSVHGYDLAKSHGLDLAAPQTYAAVIRSFSESIDAFEALAEPVDGARSRLGA